MSRHHYAVEGAEPHRLTLAGVILVPEIQSPTAPITEISPDAWSTALNAKVLNTILLTQNLLPLVTDFNSRILLLTPSVVSSLRPPHHAVESTVSGALEAFTASLAAELQLQSVPVCHFKLGNLELPGCRQRNEPGAVARVKGTSMRKLHETVFDALHAKRPSRTWHVGRGSLVYDVIGGWLPGGVVGWMLGMQSPVNKAVVPKSQELLEDDSESSVQWEKIEQLA